MSDETNRAAPGSPGLLKTPLHDLHVELGARLVPFAGYEMPIQFAGVVAEHNHTRASASLFDVAHMGVIRCWGDPAEVGKALEYVMPSAISTLKPGRQRYSFLTNSNGGIIDDLMVTRSEDGYSMVVNASRKEVDLVHIQTMLPDLDVLSEATSALIALQGPASALVLADILDDADEAKRIATMAFMDTSTLSIGGVPCGISRSGYTGEDGFEFTIHQNEVEAIARTILGHEAVKPAGLGARDTLRLEAGLCLYGNDLDETITPVEADLVWAMQKRRRTEGGFVGDDVILRQLQDGPERIRVGIGATGRRPVRDHSHLRDEGGAVVGEVSSGGFGPSVERPVAMGYVPPSLSAIGTKLVADVRGKEVPVVVADLPFSPHRYYRG